VETGPRAFSVFLQQINHGETHSILGEELWGLVRKCEQQAILVGKGKGTLTLKLTVAIDQNGNATIEPDVAVKPPKPPRGVGRFWVDRTGNLVNKDPRQQELPLREVSGKGGAPKDIGAANNATPKSV
jgi:hypothetical protein